MGRQDLIGRLEEAVLHAVLRLGANAYGVTIRKDVSERLGQERSFGAIYATLDRLERKGYLSSRVGEATPERGGRAKRYYRVEAPGERALSAAQAMNAAVQGSFPEGALA